MYLHTSIFPVHQHFLCFAVAPFIPALWCCPSIFCTLGVHLGAGSSRVHSSGSGDWRSLLNIHCGLCPGISGLKWMDPEPSEIVAGTDSLFGVTASSPGQSSDHQSGVLFSTGECLSSPISDFRVNVGMSFGSDGSLLSSSPVC